MVCTACGKTNIIEIFVVQDSAGNQFEIGSHCIINVSNEKILAQFKNYEQKHENISKNRKTIDFLCALLEANENETMPIDISKIGIQRLTGMYERACNGLNPLDTQWKLFYYYVNKIKKELS